MKYLLSTLPLAALLIGCGSNGADANSANTSPDNAATNSTTETAPTGLTQGNDKADSPAAGTDAPRGTDAATGAKGTKPAANEPDDQYRVIDEASPGMPPQVTEALTKVKVPPPPKSMKTPSKATLRLDTTKGAITVELDGKAAPLHVKSFVYLAKRGFYNNTVWHRYEPGFVIQGGDPLTKFPALSEFFGTGGPGYQVPREYNELKHGQYALAMARSEDPDSAGSQFYFTLEATPQLDEGYTVFGKVTSGQKAVAALRKGDKLTSVKVLSETP